MSGLIPSDLSIQSGIEKIARQHAERMEYELRGAWRAGYDYLHVYDELPNGGTDTPEQLLSVTQYVFPSNVEKPPRPPQLRYAYTYDLTSVPDHVLRNAIRGELDSYERIDD